MLKRVADSELENVSSAAKTQEGALPPVVDHAGAIDDEMGEFEDPYGDDFESDGEIIEVDGDQSDEEVEGEVGKTGQAAAAAAAAEEEAAEPVEELYLPHRSRPLGPDEVLEADPSVYEMLHNVTTPWPCLTVDVLPDKLGLDRKTFPHLVYVAMGTQAERAKDNQVISMKLSLLAKTLVRDELDLEEELDDDLDVDPVIESDLIPVKHTTNRLRVLPFAATTGEYLTAVSSENGEVNIYDLTAPVKSFDEPGFMVPKQLRRPIYTVRAHGNVEGYGLDWSPRVLTGLLLSGDVTGRVHLTTRTTLSWVTDKVPFTAGEALIEDIQWLHSEDTVFATAGTDGMVRIWDKRSKKHKPAVSVQALSTDVNVILWLEKLNYLLALGHDDGLWLVWDLRGFVPPANPTPVAHYDFHQLPVTLILFNPNDELIVAVLSQDNTVTLWDLSVEADDEEIAEQRANVKGMEDIPPQLLFVHWQRDVKDVRWCKQIPGALVSTGGDGLVVWKTISV